jgi:hypothetical protein
MGANRAQQETGFMPDSFAPPVRRVLIKTPSARQEAARRRLLALAGVLALILTSAVIGTLAPHGEAIRKAHTGPFSYFPSG